MTIKETTAFVAGDGTVFYTRKEAETYEAEQAALQTALNYATACVAAGLSQRTATRRASAVRGYLEWLATGEVPAAAAVSDND